MNNPLQVQIFHNPWVDATEHVATVLPQRQLRQAIEHLAVDTTRMHDRLCERQFAKTTDHFAIVLLDPTRRDAEKAHRLALIATEGCSDALINEAHEEARLYLRFGEQRALLDWIQLDVAAHQLSTGASAEYIGLTIGVAGLCEQHANSQMADYIAQEGYSRLREAFTEYRRSLKPA